MIKNIEDILKKKARINYLKKQKGDMEKTFASIKLFNKKYNFRPSVQPKEGLKKFTKWYLDFYKK